jgi:hypothetical protein
LARLFPVAKKTCVASASVFSTFVIVALGVGVAAMVATRTLIDVHVTGGSFPSGNARTSKTTVVVGASTVVVAWVGGSESTLIDVHVTGGSFPPGVARTAKSTVVVRASTVVVAWVVGFCPNGILGIVLDITGQFSSLKSGTITTSSTPV